jgi:hypothetical protein
MKTCEACGAVIPVRIYGLSLLTDQNIKLRNREHPAMGRFLEAFKSTAVAKQQR